MKEYTKESQALFIAIDIAKEQHVVLMEGPGRKRAKLPVANSRAGIDQFIAQAGAYKCRCEVAFEATGDYHRLIAYAMLRAGFNLHFVSSIATNRTREALYNTWDKNDPKDAQVILSLLKAGNTLVYHDPLEHGHHDLQELANTYQQISGRKTRIYHSILNHYLPLYFPEAERFITGSRSEWFMEVLRRTPTPSAVLATSRATFLRRSITTGGKPTIRRRLLEEFYDLAKSSIGLPVAANSPSVEMFRTVLDEFVELVRRRRHIESLVDDALARNPDYKRLITVPGIGSVLALIILAEAGDLRRFGSYKKFLKFCRLNLSSSQSGKTHGTPQLSKRGSARLRYAFWLAATSAIRQRQNGFADKYRRYISVDPDNRDLRRKAFTAVAAKMARVVHGLIKTGSDYRRRFEAAQDGRIPSPRAVEALATS